MDNVDMRSLVKSKYTEMYLFHAKYNTNSFTSYGFNKNALLLYLWCGKTNLVKYNFCTINIL